MDMWTDSARRQYQRLGRCYASDLTDEEFAVIEPMLPPAKSGGRRRTTALREMLNAILYVLRTGCPSAACWPRPFQGADRWPSGHRLADAAEGISTAFDSLRLFPPFLALRHLDANLRGAFAGSPRTGGQRGLAKCRDHRQPKRQDYGIRRNPWLRCRQEGSRPQAPSAHRYARPAARAGGSCRQHPGSRRPGPGLPAYWSSVPVADPGLRRRRLSGRPGCLRCLRCRAGTTPPRDRQTPA